MNTEPRFREPAATLDERFAGECVSVKLEDIEIRLAGGATLAFVCADVEMSHDGTDWEITGIDYATPYVAIGENSALSFESAIVKARAVDETLTHHIERIVLNAANMAYNDLCREADEIVMKRMEK